MINPINLAFKAINNYDDFWHKTNTHGKTIVHTLTMISFLSIRVGLGRMELGATNINILKIYESAAIAALLTHIFSAIFIASDQSFRY